jgi:hypothetical protein
LAGGGAARSTTGQCPLPLRDKDLQTDGLRSQGKNIVSVHALNCFCRKIDNRKPACLFSGGQTNIGQSLFPQIRDLRLR